MNVFLVFLLISASSLLSASQVEPVSAISGLQKVPAYNSGNSLYGEQFLRKLYSNSDPIPDNVDWRIGNSRVSEPKNQKKCNASWAFATVGLLEGQLNRFDVNLKDLSAQNLVDCAVKNDGCFGVEYGSTIEEAINFVVAQGGIQDELSYPYKAREQTCRFDKNRAMLKGRVKGFALLPPNDLEKLRETVAKYGPVASYMDGSRPGFINASYFDDIYVDPGCSKEPEKLLQPILVVGYGKDAFKGDYWIIKNSWSWYEWGNDGYLRVARKDNQCGIATKPVIATF